METVDTAEAFRKQVRAWRAQGLTVGFVPTMGNLHAGHLSLVREAGRRADRVCASIFVNPTQFGPGEDYTSYPRTPDADREALCAEGCHLLFMPGVEEMYPGGTAATTQVRVPELNGVLEGASRPGHFDGVATVVAKLFHMAEPDIAVFGEKDYQQLLVIRRMVRDLAWPVRVVGAPTVREADGLAMSSRNRYLTADERAQAPALYRTLRDAADAASRGRERLEAIETTALERLREAGFGPEYVAVRRADNLGVPAAGDDELIVLGAAWLGSARLIDNYPVSRASGQVSAQG